MAQYGKNFYGTVYYGNTNVYSGQYTTKEVNTDEPLKGTFDVKLTAVLPEAWYPYYSPECRIVSGSWVNRASFGYMETDDANAEIRYMVTCDRIVICYEQYSGAPTKVNVEVTTTEIGGTPVTTTYQFNPNKSTINPNATFVIDNLPFAEQQVRIYLEPNNPANAYFRFKGVRARTSDIIIETRARTNTGTWTDWTRINETKTPISGRTNAYTLQATSPNYAGKNRVQVRLFLGTSDNELTPVVEKLEMISGDSDNRTDDGWWVAKLHMPTIASSISKTFKEVTEITWQAQVPTATDMKIRSSSSNDPSGVTGWTKWTVPYRRNTYRIRLRPNASTGWVETPLISPDSVYPFTRTVQWTSLKDVAMLPPSEEGTAIKYLFLNTDKDPRKPLYVIQDPTKKGQVKEISALGNRDFYLRIQLDKLYTNDRTRDAATPVVDLIELTSLMEYEQDYEQSDIDFSAVDNNNTGERVIFDVSQLASSNYFTPPPEAGSPQYTLIDKTERPQDVVLYLDSQKDKSIRDGKFYNLATEKIWAQAKVRAINGTTGLLKHYQQGGGTVTYPDVDETEMSPVFTPSLNPNKKYRYYLMSGWPTSTHVVMPGDTWESIAAIHAVSVEELKQVNPNPLYDANGNLLKGQTLVLPNHSVNPNVSMKWKSTNSNLTDKSAHNAMLLRLANKESDIISVSVINSSFKGDIPWISEEKKYKGYININDLRSEYRRTLIVPDEESVATTYVVLDGETFASIAKKFGVDEIDLRKANEGMEEVEAGQTIQIPARITLPSIDPRARISDNPYKVTIIANSVRKKNGEVLPDDVVYLKAPLQVTYKTITIEGEKVVRGPVVHGKDPLKRPRVVSIKGIWSKDDYHSGVLAPTWIPYNDFTNTGDYRLTHNSIDWSPADGDEPLPGEVYYVTYTCEVPDTLTIVMDTNYQEEGGVDRIWRSMEVKEFQGMCSPGQDFRMELPPIEEWIDTQQAIQQGVEDITYVVEDNDLWVKTWVEYDQENDKYYLVGSLQDRVPKDNWFPTIKTGYYYLGKDEYYLFSEPITVSSTKRDMPVASNVLYVPAKYQHGILTQEASSNLLRNSGFDIATSDQVVFKRTFGV